MRLRLIAVCTGVALALLAGTAQNSTAQEQGLERLNASPRHHEWVPIASDGREVHTFVAYPEISGKATAVIVIHENRGLTDWVRAVADQLAEAGYIALAPDLLSGMGPDGGRTKDFADQNAARDAIYALDDARVTADLKAVAKYATALPAANGKLVVGGFCWGGSQTFRFAMNHDGLAAACAFYGTAPETGFDTIACPVYGFYGGSDARVTATVPDTEAKMKAAGKTYEAVVYEGAGHGFMRAGEEAGASAENKKAMEAGWERWKSILAEVSK
jgi:carboxymethylenebutenolidase